MNGTGMGKRIIIELATMFVIVIVFFWITFPVREYEIGPIGLGDIPFLETSGFQIFKKGFEWLAWAELAIWGFIIQRLTVLWDCRKSEVSVEKYPTASRSHEKQNDEQSNCE